MPKYLIIAIYDAKWEIDVVSYDKEWSIEEKCELVNYIYEDFYQYKIPDDVYERYDLIVVVEDGEITVIKAVSA